MQSTPSFSNAGRCCVQAATGLYFLHLVYVLSLTTNGVGAADVRWVTTLNVQQIGEGTWKGIHYHGVLFWATAAVAAMLTSILLTIVAV